MQLKIEKVVVTGGREFADVARIEADLRALAGVGLRRLAHGGARGCDTRTELAWRKAKPWPRETEVYEVTSEQWKRHREAAGPMRNARMLDAEKPDLVLAYPNPPTSKTASVGTWDCVAAALKRGIRVVVWAAPEIMPDYSDGARFIYQVSASRWVLVPKAVGDVEGHVFAYALGGVLPE